MAPVEVRSRIPGTPTDAVPAVLVDVAGLRTTVGELIGRVVEEQIRLLRTDNVRCRQILDRQYLSADDMRVQAAAGAVRMPSPPTELSVADEVSRAHRAFADNVFVVFVGGRQAERLDEQVVLTPGEPVLFLRLTPLVGG